MALADDIFARYKGKGKSPAPETDDKEVETDEDKPGSNGMMLAAALKKGDGEAIEEAVRAICG